MNWFGLREQTFFFRGKHWHALVLFYNCRSFLQTYRQGLTEVFQPTITSLSPRLAMKIRRSFEEPLVGTPTVAGSVALDQAHMVEFSNQTYKYFSPTARIQKPDLSFVVTCN